MEQNPHSKETQKESRMITKEAFMDMIRMVYGPCNVNIDDNGEIQVVLPRDDSFLPPEVSNEYYDAVVNVMEFANCTKEEAIDALEKTQNNVDKAIHMYNPDYGSESETEN